MQTLLFFSIISTLVGLADGIPTNIQNKNIERTSAGGTHRTKVVIIEHHKLTKNEKWC